MTWMSYFYIILVEYVSIYLSVLAWSSLCMCIHLYEFGTPVPFDVPLLHVVTYHFHV